VLLAALAQAFNQWTGARILLLDLEGHGRQEVIEGMDLSRTVGWFTSVFPVCINLEEAQTPRQALISVKEQLRCIPENGINYGVLRYLSKEGSKALQNLPKAELTFNYLGQLDQTLSGTIFQPGEESAGPGRSPRGQRSYLVEINSSISAGRLQLVWIYSRNCHRSSSIEQFAAYYMQALREIIAHCQAVQTSESTAADFPAARLSQSELERLFGAVE
jgi:non-ribosomal peptide synthase protein (TIGR01720 family)